jgi:hypothetical protein
VLVTAEHENNKDHTHHKTSRQYPANQSPYGGRLKVLSGVSCAALETDNVIRSAASCFSTTPHWNHFSTGRAFSRRYFHDYLSTDICVQRPAPHAHGGVGRFGVRLAGKRTGNGKLSRGRTSPKNAHAKSPAICSAHFVGCSLEYQFAQTCKQDSVPIVTEKYRAALYHIADACNHQ